MTVVDERSRVPDLDADAISRLTAALDRPEVIAAYLFGSQARGTARPLSDVDVAILHTEDLDPSERFDLRLSLLADARVALSTDEIDLVPLNEAPSLLRHRALRDGVRLIDRDPAERIRFEVRTFNDYVDTKPLRKLLSRRLRTSIEEDRFGRRP